MRAGKGRKKDHRKRGPGNKKRAQVTVSQAVKCLEALLSHLFSQPDLDVNRRSPPLRKTEPPSVEFQVHPRAENLLTGKHQDTRHSPLLMDTVTGHRQLNNTHQHQTAVFTVQLPWKGKRG